MKIFKSVALWSLVALGLMAIALGGCATVEKEAKSMEKAVAGKKAPASFPCAARGKLIRATTPDAKLVGLKCSFKKYDGVKSLAVKVSLKNVSKTDQRYRVHIFLDNDKAVGGLIPRKTKKGLVKPGKTASFTYYFKGQSTKPGAVTLIVKTVSK